MPRTHEAFQEAIMELSQIKPPPSPINQPHDQSKVHHEAKEYLFGKETSSTEYSSIRGMGSKEEDDSLSNMGTDDKNSCHHFTEHLRLFSQWIFAKFQSRLSHL
jgi:hypothetical protein